MFFTVLMHKFTLKTMGTSAVLSGEKKTVRRQLSMASIQDILYI